MTITYTSTIAMTGRTSVTAADTITVDAIDYIQYACTHGDSAVEIDLSPAAATLVQFIAIIGSAYPTVVASPDPDITYKWNGTGTTAVGLGNHHIYSSGMDVLTAGTTKLYVYNAGGTDASNSTLTFIIGRDLA